MNKKQIKIIFSITILIIALTIIPNAVNGAGYVANNSGYVIDHATTVFSNIRYMESRDGTLGVDSNIGSDFSDSSDNKIDCHMSKTSEFEAAYFLQKSAYAAKTYYGTISGVYTPSTGTYLFWTANLWRPTEEDEPLTNDYLASLTTAYNSTGTRYVDLYTGDSTAFRRDSLDSDHYTYIFKLYDSGFPIFVSSTKRGLNGQNTFNGLTSSNSDRIFARATIVNGENIH